MLLHLWFAHWNVRNTKPTSTVERLVVYKASPGRGLVSRCVPTIMIFGRKNFWKALEWPA